MTRSVKMSRCLLVVSLLAIASIAAAATAYIQTNLVSDVPGLAPTTNPKLINPWGRSEGSDGLFRVTANGTGRAIPLDAQGEREGGDIIIPPPPGSPSKTTSAPNGVVGNDTSDFVITFK